MNKIIFTEEFCQPENLHPFTLTRQIQDIRVGILTIREKWELMMGFPSWDKIEDDYKDLGRATTIADAVAGGHTCFIVHGNLLPTPELVKEALRLKNGEFLSVQGAEGIIFRVSGNEVREQHRVKVKKAVMFAGKTASIRYPWDIFHLNDRAIRDDFRLLTHRRKSQPLARTNRVLGRSQVFLEKGAQVSHCVLNAEQGPIYIGRDALVMEGCLIRGPFAMGEKSVLKMGTRVYGATTLGPACTGGGEIKNSVLFGYSNKAHDGYLGDSVIGEWCNLGAGTTNSNLKNNAGEVELWLPDGKLGAGKKCGVLMGDFSRTAVNTAINTGTVIGVSCNVFGSGLTPKYIPNFAWGSEGIARYRLDKALTDAQAWKQLKGQSLTDDERKVLKHIFDHF